MNNFNEWYETFFEGLWLDVQRKIDSEQNIAEAKFIENVLELSPGDKVLDIPCGTGRHAIELASHGYKLTGVDKTSQLLDDAREQAVRMNLKMEFHLMDMREISWENEFNEAYNFWGSFGYFDEKGNRDFVMAIHRALVPGGKFLIEGHIAETFLPIFSKKDWHTIDDIIILEEREFDYINSRIDATWTLISGTTRFKRVSSMRIYSYRELCHLLESVGFHNFKAYDTKTGKDFEFGDRRITLVATKK